MATNPEIVREHFIAAAKIARMSANLAEELSRCAANFVVNNMVKLRKMVGVIPVQIEEADALAASAHQASEAVSLSAKTAANAAAEAAAAMEEADSKKESDKRSAQTSLNRAVVVAAESARAAAETVRIVHSVADTIEKLRNELPALPNHVSSVGPIMAGTAAARGSKALIGLAGTAEEMASDFAKYVKVISENIILVPDEAGSSRSARRLRSASRDEELLAEANKTAMHYLDLPLPKRRG